MWSRKVLRRRAGDLRAVLGRELGAKQITTFYSQLPKQQKSLWCATSTGRVLAKKFVLLDV
jgi:hypothetical protein